MIRDIWLCVGICVGCALVGSADESPSIIADAVTLASRVADLEARVQALENAAKPVQAATAKPVLEVHSESWCGPCQRFKSDVAAFPGELPVEIRYVKFSDRVPAFRWTDSSGKQVTRTGYASGGLQSLFDDVAGGR
jgi:hypothetical protein